MGRGIVDRPYPVAKSMDEPDLLEAAHRLNPNGVFIYRHYYDNPVQAGRLRDMETSIEGAFNQWFAENEGLLQRLKFAYHESYNEVGAPDQYLAFEKYRIERLAEKGYKACVLNIASGNTTKEMWKRAQPMVQAAIEHGALIGVHCYAEGVISANCNDSYWDEQGNWQGELFPRTIDPDKAHTALRIVRDKRDLTVQGQGRAVLVCTELGLDDMSFPGNGIFKPFGIKTRGWRSCVQVWARMGWLNGTTPEKFYAQQMDWWAKVTGCLGTIYTNGNGNDSTWDDYDVAGVL